MNDELVQKRAEATVSLLKLALSPENSIKRAKKERKKEDLGLLSLESRCTNPECKIRALTMQQDDLHVRARGCHS